jgi:predicted phage terminase large subunit-like protein
LLLVSRGHLKTTIHTVAHCIQWILNYPDVRILICTATDEKARMMVNDIRGHFQFNPRLRFLFPEFCPDSKKASDFGSQTEFTIPNRERRAKEPTVMTASVGKALASTHHDVIKCSDVVTENNVKTGGQIAEVKEFFGYLDPLREKFFSKDGKPNPGWLDIEGTIYDFSDQYQTILDQVKRGDAPWWKVTQRSCWVDKVKRISLWPERFPPLQLDRILKQIGPVLFASQYELNPVSPESALATLEQIKFFPVHIVKTLLPRYRVLTTVDLSNPNPNVKGGADPDYCVFTTAGFDTDGRCDVLSIYRDRFPQDDLVEMFFLLQKRWPSNRVFKVQKDHYAHALEPLMKREMAKRGIYLNIEFTPISTSVSKVWKIQQLQGWFRMGLLRFADNISFKEDLILEILRFPRGAHDDILYTLSDLFHNSKSHASWEVLPDAPKGTYPLDDTFQQFSGFDPITKEAQWIRNVIEDAHSEYNLVTGAL